MPSRSEFYYFLLGASYVTSRGAIERMNGAEELVADMKARFRNGKAGWEKRLQALRMKVTSDERIFPARPEGLLKISSRKVRF